MSQLTRPGADVLRTCPNFAIRKLQVVGHATITNLRWWQRP